MLIGFIKHNRAFSIVILPVALILLWLHAFLNPVTPLTENACPVYGLLISGIKEYPFIVTLISCMLILCEALLLNFIIEKNEIINTTTYLPALIYILLMGLQPEMFSLHPIIISNLFILLALHKLMQTYRKETAYSGAFDTGFFISLACLFYAPSIVFVLMFWIGLIIIRPFIWREWVLSLLGFLLPFVYLLFVYFWTDKLQTLEQDMLYKTIISTNKSLHTITFSLAGSLQALILLSALFLSSGRFLNDFGKGTVRLRNYLLLLVYCFILALISIILAPEYSIVYLSFLAIPFSVFFTSYLLFAKKGWVAEILFLLLVISIFINQFIP